jgi:hydrogenase/urease accessory protein HupE
MIFSVPPLHRSSPVNGLLRPAAAGRQRPKAPGSKKSDGRFSFAWILIALAILCAPARAHDPGISSAQGELRADRLVITTGFAPADAQQLLPPSLHTEEKWGQQEFERVRGPLLALAPQLWEAQAGGSVLAPTEPHVELLPGDNVSFRLTYVRPSDAETIVLRAPKLPELPTGHRQFVIISDERGSMITKKLLSARDMVIEVPLTGGATPAAGAAVSAVPADQMEAPTIWGFIKLGVEHIWTGYDHLLFLFALLVVCRTFRSIVAIISCFTLAHSITLALATLNVVNLPPRLVEAAIAASIVYVGAENLLRRGAEPRGRWALTFAFGLIHGFGFASVLRDLGVGGNVQGIAMPLFTFNLGVEVGQMAIAAVVLPLVWQLRKNETFVRRGVPLLSAIVALAGLYWLWERALAI